MFNRSARAAVAEPAPLALRESLLSGFASEGLWVPARPAALDRLLQGDPDECAAREVAEALGREGINALPDGASIKGELRKLAKGK